MLEVTYEELVDDFEPQVRRILAYCGLEWDDACLAFHRTDRPVRTASFTQVRRPIYRSAVARWQRYESFLGPLVAALEGAESAPAPGPEQAPPDRGGRARPAAQGGSSRSERSRQISTSAAIVEASKNRDSSRSRVRG